MLSISPISQNLNTKTNVAFKSNVKVNNYIYDAVKYAVKNPNEEKSIEFMNALNLILNDETEDIFEIRENFSKGNSQPRSEEVLINDHTIKYRPLSGAKRESSIKDCLEGLARYARQAFDNFDGAKLKLETGQKESRYREIMEQLVRQQP